MFQSALIAKVFLTGLAPQKTQASDVSIRFDREGLPHLTLPVDFRSPVPEFQSALIAKVFLTAASVTSMLRRVCRGFFTNPSDTLRGAAFLSFIFAVKSMFSITANLSSTFTLINPQKTVAAIHFK